MSDGLNPETGFKRCSCGKTWTSIDDLVNDPEMYYVGVSVLGSKTLFLFTHSSCHSTISVSTELLGAHFLRANVEMEKKSS